MNRKEKKQRKQLIGVYKQCYAMTNGLPRTQSFCKQLKSKIIKLSEGL